MAIVAELSYDDIANGIYPDTSYAKRWQQATLQAAEQMHRAHSGERLTRALDLVLTNAVTLNPDGTATVKSGSRTYEINGRCACEDAKRRTIWCKHKLAVEIHKRANALLQDTSHSDVQEPSQRTQAQATFTSGGRGGWLTPKPINHIQTEGFPPSTCCIKDVIGTREISWTLRGEDDAVSTRLQRVLRFLDELKERIP